MEDPGDVYESEIELRHSTLADALKDEDQRALLGLPSSDDELCDVVVELNLMHNGGLIGAKQRFDDLFKRVRHDFGATGAASPTLVANTYLACRLTMNEVRALIEFDEVEPGEPEPRATPPRERAIYRVWPDFPVKPLIDKSIATVKADAARRSYEASGTGITWAVIDSGIDAEHPHFLAHDTLGGEVASLHKDFTGGDSPLTDEYGHGTHVAGIIAGSLDAPRRGEDTGQGDAPGPPRVAQKVAGKTAKSWELARREGVDAERLAGVAPHCKLVSLKVLDARGRSLSTQILAALQHIRENLNGNGKLQQVHGVNLSVGYEFDAQWFACGQSPLCVEVDRLVKSGVVVVVAAGNTGYGSQSSDEGRAKTGLTLTINDPGNAALAITVGATHRDSPHTYGVSYFSSKGPTGDGRLKPDLVAPGERITSCAAGRRLAPLNTLYEGEPPSRSAYIDESGTSMAAPHVSGVIAAFLSIRREFIGRPEEVKRIFLENATSLGRERYFEGHGMVDLMRAIQAV